MPAPRTAPSVPAALAATTDVDDIGAEPLAPLPHLTDDEKRDPRVQLGRRLFFSTALSNDGATGPRCAYCHPLGAGGASANYVVKIPKSQPARFGSINSPTVFNAGFNFRHTWDGKDETLELVATRPIKAKSLMGGDGDAANIAAVQQKLKLDGTMVAGFAAARLAIDEAGIGIALAAYLRALAPRDAPFDRWLRHERNVFSPDAEEGYALFKKLGCASCHQGRGVGGTMFARFGELVPRAECTECKRWLPASMKPEDEQGEWIEPAKCPTDQDVKDRGIPACAAWNPHFANDGRISETTRGEDLQVFKVPSLRNVALTAPYFHDASAATLRDAIKTMAALQLDRTLTEREVDVLEEFLKSLTGIVDPDLAADPFLADADEHDRSKP